MKYRHVGQNPESNEYWSFCLDGLIPANAIPHSARLLSEGPMILHLSRSRSTKLGHFKKSPAQQFPEISINEDLGEERFLFTLIHEIAHWKAFRDFGRKIKPHGVEWKNTFKNLMLPILNDAVFSPIILRALAAHLISPKASTCSDPLLQRTFDKLEGIQNMTLDELELGRVFQLQTGRRFIKGERKRTRYLCAELVSRRKFLIPGLIPVLEVPEEKSVL